VPIARAVGGPSSSMLLGMWTTAATFYGLVFVDFPSLQQLGRLLGHSMAARAAPRRRAADAAVRGNDRPAAASAARVQRDRDARPRRRGDAHPHQPDA